MENIEDRLDNKRIHEEMRWTEDICQASDNSAGLKMRVHRNDVQM